ncbi:MAG TPA: DUF262 domain-containing protein [Candidatus Alistipes faecigallinarum]|nr:DUF262 domain-containing protein [Candidatus Alistipes faecigallinarum]
MNNDKVSFWKLLNDKKIVIPIIQRDYAQGREGREFLRERFLGQLFDALKGATPLVLDFVYGSVEGDTFYPLDGQQRLTTLWLLHWYLALCAETLSEDKKVLEKFSYETRISSRTFCQKLCGITQSYQPQKHGIAAFVRNQTWFYSAYEQDPTVQSMLRMLNGTDISDSNKMDITDGIEEYCIQAELTKEKAKELLDRLKGEDAPIGFYLLNMEDKDMPLADDLYIKMNARGKVLTDFENFKVDLLKYKLSSREYLIPANDMGDESFSRLLDTRWTDLFWHYRSAECHIDEIYMSFFNRFFLNWYIANTEESADEVVSSNLYKAVSAAETRKGSHYRYLSISIYEPALTGECIEALSKCLNRMCDLYNNAKGDNKQKLQAINPLFMPYWEEVAENEESDQANKIFSFIPRYATDKDTNTPAPITLKQQVVFHAVCVYLTNCEKVETENLKDWMHFVWNMVENSYLDSKQSVGAIRFFDKGPKIENNEAPGWACDNIIDYLAGIDVEQMKSDVFGRRQLLEEIAKAKQIKQNPDWEHNIHEAEKAAFFKGAIAFLFNNEKGETDWSNFDTKWKTAQELFDKDGVKADKTVAAMQALYSYCDDWGSQFWWNAKIFNGKANTWKDQILTKVAGNNQYVYAKPVHYLLLMGARPLKERKEDRRLRLLSSNSLIEHLVKENPKGQDMYIRYPHDSLYYCGKKFGVMLYYESRDKCLNELLKNNKIKLLAGQNEKISIKNDDGNEVDAVFWGDLNINFDYYPENGEPLHLQWYQGGSSTEYEIYLMNEDWIYKMRPTPLEDEKGDRKRYYCFNLHIDESPGELSGKTLADQFCKQVKEEFGEFMKNPAE